MGFKLPGIKKAGSSLENLDLNISDNIGQANLIGTVYNPKKSLSLQTKPNLQIGGTLNFEEIMMLFLLCLKMVVSNQWLLGSIFL